ncbi:hypothetical protein D3C76_1276760 [compost metagenome]
MRQRWVLAPGFFPARQVFRRGTKTLQRERLGEVMGGAQSIEHLAQRRRQCLQRGDAAGPQGVATVGRQLLGAEYRTQCRGGQEGHVGVPHGVVAHVGDGGVEHQHLRGFRHVGVDRVNMQVAKARGKVSLLLWVDRLVTEEQHLMLEQGLLDAVTLFVVDRAAEVDTADLCAECSAQRSNGQAHG